MQMLYTTEFEKQMQCRKTFMTELEYLTLLDVPNAVFLVEESFVQQFPFQNKHLFLLTLSLGTQLKLKSARSNLPAVRYNQLHYLQ